MNRLHLSFSKLPVWILAIGLAMMLPLPGLAQPNKPKTVTLDMQNEPIEAVLEEMSNQLGKSISAHNNLLGTLISLQLENATAEEAIVAVLKGHPWEAIINRMTGAVTIWEKAGASMSRVTAPTVPGEPDDTATPLLEEDPMPQTDPSAPDAVPAQAVTPSANWMKNEWGERAMQPFQNAPYPHLSREGGWTYQDQTYPRDLHYTDNTVGVFIPAGFKPEPEVNFIVHFHGWMNDVDGVFDSFGLDKQVADSGVNAILLVVQGPKQARDSGGGRLEQEEGAFRALIAEVAQFLTAEGKIAPDARLGKIVLTAHSGGYRVTSWILKIGGLNESISDVLLFDASYADYENFVNWAVEGQNRRLVSIFTEHLREDNLELMTLCSRRKIPFSVMPVGDMSPDTLLGRWPIFIYVPKDEEDKGLVHNQVVSARDFYALWLRTSALPPR